MANDSKYPTRIAPYGLRMPDDLKTRVQSAAEANNRSMNAEIVAALESKYPRPLTADDLIFAFVRHLAEQDQALSAEAVERLKEQIHSGRLAHMIETWRTRPMDW